MVSGVERQALPAREIKDNIFICSFPQFQAVKTLLYGLMARRFELVKVSMKCLAPHSNQLWIMLRYTHMVWWITNKTTLSPFSFRKSVFEKSYFRQKKCDEIFMNLISVFMFLLKYRFECMTIIQWNKINTVLKSVCWILISKSIYRKIGKLL